MIGRKIFKFLGFIAGLLIVYGIGYIVLENHNHREKQLNNIEITPLSDILKTNDKTNEFFTYGETKQFSVFTSEVFKEKCLKSQPEYVHNRISHIMKISSNNLFGRKYTVEQVIGNNSQLIKLLPANLNISKINCPDFVYDKNQNDFLYRNKPVRFLLNNSYRHYIKSSLL